MDEPGLGERPEAMAQLGGAFRRLLLHRRFLNRVAAVRVVVTTEEGGQEGLSSIEARALALALAGAETRALVYRCEGQEPSPGRGEAARLIKVIAVDKAGGELFRLGHRVT